MSARSRRRHVSFVYQDGAWRPRQLSFAWKLQDEILGATLTVREVPVAFCPIALDQERSRPWNSQQPCGSGLSAFASQTLQQVGLDKQFVLRGRKKSGQGFLGSQDVEARGRCVEMRGRGRFK